MKLLKLDTAQQTTVIQHALLAWQSHRQMCVSVRKPWGALVICVCFSVKCSIGFCSFPQDLSPTIKIHLIFITPKLLLHIPNSLSLCSLPSPPCLLSFCISSHASAALVHLIDFPPAVSLTLSFSSCPVYWHSSSLIAFLLSHCLFFSALLLRYPQFVSQLHLVCQREETSIFQSKLNVT